MTQIPSPVLFTADLAMTREVGAAAFKHDRAAQEAVRLFQEKQRSLQAMQQLGMLEVRIMERSSSALITRRLTFRRSRRILYLEN